MSMLGSPGTKCSPRLSHHHGRSGPGSLGFAPSQRRVPGLLLPLHTTNGRSGPAIYRPDNPRIVENRRQKNADGAYPQRVIKYEQPKGESVRVDCPPTAQPKLADPSVPLFITEGQKKADALVSRGACAIALTGVWNWKSRNEYGGTTFSNDLDYIAWENRQVYLVFDADVMSKQGVRQALERFTDHLKRQEAVVSHIYLPPLAMAKQGWTIGWSPPARGSLTSSYWRRDHDRNQNRQRPKWNCWMRLRRA
jgi:hypothetical protein